MDHLSLPLCVNLQATGPSSRTCTTKKTPVSEAYVDLAVDSPSHGLELKSVKQLLMVVHLQLLLQCHVLVLHMQLRCNV